MKKVSIIVPVYNVERYLPECLDSILDQSYPKFELILVDDGSTDGSALLCDEYAARDNRIVLVHQKNAGAANAKNAALDLASGDYIAFVDSDDWVERDWLQRMVSVLEQREADLVECSFVREFRNRTEAGNDEAFVNRLFSTEEYLSQYLSIWTCSLFWNKLFKRELTENIRFRKERRCIDDEFYTYKVVSEAKRIQRIHDTLYHYRQRQTSAVSMNEKRFQRTNDALEILIERYEWVTARFPALRRQWLEHDVDMMTCFAREFPFREREAKLFRKLAWYYLGQCSTHWVSNVTYYYALKNAFFYKKLIGRDQEKTCDIKKNYFE